MVAPSRFCHIVYRTKRFDEMVKWYLDVFEAKIQVGNDRIAFLTYDDEHHRFAIAAGDEATAGRAPRNAVGMVHVAYAWNSLEELIFTYKRLKALGIVPVRPTRHGVTLSLYYDDPDGNNMEFQIDLMTPDEANRYMLTEAFRANPSGELFDPDILAARFDSGLPVNDLIFRSDQHQRLEGNWRKDSLPVIAVHA